MAQNDQKQSADGHAGHALALQAARDINYYGLSVGEVKELCALFLRENFAKLREDAQQAAEKNIQAFVRILESRLSEAISSVSIDKLRDPDVQASINDAVVACARKGEKAHPEILSALIAQRVAIESTDFDEILLREAIVAVPKLTSRHIKALSLGYCIKLILEKDRFSVEQFEEYGKTFESYLSGGFPLEPADRQHMIHTGVFTISLASFEDIISKLKSKISFSSPTGFLTSEHKRQMFASHLQANAPTAMGMFMQADQYKITYDDVSGVGKAIANSYCSKLSGTFVGLLSK